MTIEWFFALLLGAFAATNVVVFINRDKPFWRSYLEGMASPLSIFFRNK